MLRVHRGALPAAAVLAGLAALLFVQSLFAQQNGNWTYFRSNAVGMALEEIPPDEAVFQPGDEKMEDEQPEDEQPSGPETGEDRQPEDRQPPEFILKKRTLPSGTREEVLLHSGDEVYTRSIEIQGGERVEREFRGGEKVREIIERSGRPVYEWQMEDDGKVIEREYRWEEERLLSYTEKYGDEEKEIVYLGQLGGRLGQVRENGRIISYVYGEGGDLAGEWISRGDQDEIISYGQDGRYSVQIWNRDELVRSRTGIPENGTLRVIQKDEATGEETVEIYNAENRLQEKIIRRNGALTREMYTYIHGRLSEKKVRSPNRDRLFLYTYNAEGDLEEVDVRENGRKSKKIIYYGEGEAIEDLSALEELSAIDNPAVSGDMREEIIYRNGEPLYRDVYRGEVLILRESVE